MWLTGLDRNRRFVNRAYVDFLGRPYNEALVFDWRTILHPEDHDRIVSESIAGEATLRPFALEARYLGGDGAWHWLHSISQPLIDDHGEHIGFIGAAFDQTEAKAAEAHLRDAEERLRLATESAGIGTWDWDLPRLRGTWSAQAQQILGIEHGTDIPLEERMAAVLPEDREALLKRFGERVADGGEFDMEYRIVRPSGEIRWVASRGVMLRDKDGQVVRGLGTMVDITERKIAQEKMRVAEERLRLATEAAGIGTWDWDVEKALGTWSPAAQRILGVSSGENITLEQSYLMIHVADRPQVNETLKEALAGEGDYEIEHRIVRPDGEVRWVSARGTRQRDAAGNTIRTIGTLQDVTARRAAQERLEALNRSLETAIGQRTQERDAMWRLSRDLLLVLDPRLRILAVNPVIRELTGYSEDEALGGRLAGFIHPLDWPVVVEAVRQGRRERVRDVEARLVTREGEVRCFVWNATPEGGRAYVSGRDVTDERARNAELDAAQEALRQSQKLEAIGQLTGGVAHDFNNLLSPIIGGLDILKRRGVGGEREHRLIDGALQSADRARLLVQRLLAFARRQPLQVSAVALGPLVDELRGLLVSTLGPRIELSIDIADGLPAVTADPNQLEMAILNLIVNARDAMPDGGSLRISADLAGEDDEADRFVELNVADSGIGMDEVTLARATEPFFSSKGIGKGTGLGLSMVDGLTAQLGGSLAIASRAGEGTVISLRLPVAAAPAARAAEPGAEKRNAARGKILLVDDEPLVRLATADALTDEGFLVAEAASGEEALAVLDREPGFDCVVTDYLMPGLNGVDLARRLRELYPRLPVMLLSGYAELDAFGSELPYLAKPCLTEALTRMIGELIAPVNDAA